VVQDPPQPKIKLKMTPGLDTPVVGAKKITIHVGGSRGSTTASPAPQIGQSSELVRPDATVNGNRSFPPPGASTTSANFQVDRARNLPGAGVSPSPSLMGATPNVAAQQSPAVFQRPNGIPPNMMNTPNGVLPSGQNFQPLPTPQFHNGHPATAPAPVPLIWDKKYRAPGRGRSSGEVIEVQNMNPC
jgi:hypothetical protein